MRWAWGLQHKLGRVLGRVGHQHGAPLNDLALRGSPSANARIEWAAVKIRIAFFVADFFHPSLNAHHAFQLDPMKLQRGKRVTGQFLAFLTVVIGVPDDAALVTALDQHHPGAGAQIAGHGGQRHGVGLGNLRGDGFFQPLLKLGERIGLRCVLTELGFFVAFAKVCDVHGMSIDRRPWVDQTARVSRAFKARSSMPKRLKLSSVCCA